MTTETQQINKDIKTSQNSSQIKQNSNVVLLEKQTDDLNEDNEPLQLNQEDI